MKISTWANRKFDQYLKVANCLYFDFEDEMFGIETALEIRSKNAIPTKTYENGSFLLLFESGENGRSPE